MKRHVAAIRVEVDIWDEHGQIETYIADGVPDADGADIRLMPDHHTEFSRSQQRVILNEVVACTVHVDARLVPQGGRPVHRVIRAAPETFVITEHPEVEQ